jgi:hypothetical protein
MLDQSSISGLTDPTIGIRYSGVRLSTAWYLSLEAAAKIPLGGRRFLLSTGRADVGVQTSIQRRGKRHGLYADIAAVYYAGTVDPAPQDAQIIPTLVLGYEFKWTSRTNLNVQTYFSNSVYSHEQTDLEELIGPKYQYSVGLRHRRNNLLFTVAFTENVQNVNNTPDIGFQLGVAYVPHPRSE